MNIDKLIQKAFPNDAKFSFGSLMNIDKLIPRFSIMPARVGFGSLMNIDKLIPNSDITDTITCFGSLMNIKLKETACGILFCKLLFYNQRGDRGTAFFGII